MAGFSVRTSEERKGGLTPGGEDRPPYCDPKRHKCVPRFSIPSGYTALTPEQRKGQHSMSSNMWSPQSILCPQVPAPLYPQVQFLIYVNLISASCAESFPCPPFWSLWYSGTSCRSSCSQKDRMFPGSSDSTVLFRLFVITGSSQYMLSLSWNQDM